jgi:hypothetical protein
MCKIKLRERESEFCFGEDTTHEEEKTTTLQQYPKEEVKMLMKNFVSFTERQSSIVSFFSAFIYTTQYECEQQQLFEFLYIFLFESFRFFQAFKHPLTNIKSEKSELSAGNKLLLPRKK